MPEVIGFEWYWDAYSDLTTCRHVGMAEGAIPWTAIQHYAEAHRLGVEDTWMLHQVIRSVDSGQLNEKAEEREREANKNEARNRQRTTRGRLRGRR